MKPTLNLSEVRIDDVKTSVKYCTTPEIHNLHIQKSIAAGYPSIPVVDASVALEETLAIVCSGPSLEQTWEQVKMCNHVLTCSGAHDYMVERGIIPHFHMETDPRPHKAIFTSKPDKRTTYLIASSCHPDVFKNLEGHDVRLWHVVPANELHRIPRGHYMVTGGCNVGLRALVVARLMGYRKVHVFGMDCSAKEDEYLFHVNAHPNEPKEKSRRMVVVGDRAYYTCDIFIECARQFFKETMLLSDLEVTLHGDGLLQALAQQKMNDPEEIGKRDKFIKERGQVAIALALPKTISQEYQELNRQLHRDCADYGGHGYRYAPLIRKLIEKTGARSILDYGAGKGALAAELPFPIWEYDPCVPGKEASPRPADLVVCTDVMEHIEPDNLNAVLEDIRRCTLDTAFFSIHTGAAVKTLPDGRNTHLIQQPLEWWRGQLERHFQVVFAGMAKGTGNAYFVVKRREAEARQAA